jgi:hypothetical protein
VQGWFCSNIKVDLFEDNMKYQGSKDLGLVDNLGKPLNNWWK